MTNSLFTALSGMQVHQQWIDVIGNNLANSNTPGFKSSRAIFADALTQTLRTASGPVGLAGGRNPLQIGLGVVMSAVGRNLSQGALTTTGRVFDLALEGEGFFALSNGAQRFYTRVGTFGLDGAENLVDQRTGMRVLDPAGQPVQVDVNGLLPPKATSSLELAGNLPALVTGPLPEVLTAATAFKEGSPAMLAGSVTGPFAVAAGSTYTMDLEIVGQTPQEVSITDSDLDGLLTTAEVVAAIDGLEGVEAADNAGSVEIYSSRTGAAISLRVTGGSVNDLAGLVGVAPSTVSGSETDVSVTTDLSTLPGNVDDYVVGDQIDIVGVDTDGTPVNATFTYGVDGTTVAEFVTFLDAQFTDAQVSLNAAGQLEVAARTAGEAGLLLTIVDDAGAAGSSDWPGYGLSVSTEGTGPDIVTTSTEIFDSVGMAHALTLEFERQQDLTWTLTASVDDAEGAIQSLPIEGIAFQEDGTPVGLGLIDNSVTLRFANLPNQRIALDFGTDGGFDALTQFGSQATAFVEHQDGFADGKLSSIGVSADGVIQGFYTNGQSQDLGSVGIATFTNPEGLEEVVSNLWVETSNSGALNLNAADSQNGGSVVGGALENSNVDTAEQFVRLIEAQRGFQANARVISTQDEVLAELVNLL